MKIYLKCEDDKNLSNLPAYTIVELQGNIENEITDYSGLKLGDLIKKTDTQYVLNIGIYSLLGSVIKLQKPLLITKNETDNQHEPKILIVGICRQKILFNKRPTPLLDNQLKRIKLSDPK